MATPCALIASCSALDPKDFTKQIMQTDQLPSSHNLCEDVEAFPWSVDTKYYTADVNLCTTSNRTIGNKEFADSVHAFVVHCDSQELSSFDKVNMWIPFLREIQPEVQILACDRCCSTGLTKETAWAWCLENSFELVELNPDVDDVDDDEDDFKETIGIQRIIQALHAHTWPNLEMKDESSFRSPYMNKMMQEEAVNNRNAEESQFDEKREEENNVTNNAETSVSLKEDDRKLEESPDSPEKSPPPSCENKSTADSNVGSTLENNRDEMQLLEELTFDDDTAEESFEQLFDKLRVMKEKAESLPLDQRKLYAEQVAVKFWKAIGGDEDEITGLSDSD